MNLPSVIGTYLHLGLLGSGRSAGNKDLTPGDEREHSGNHL